MIHSFVYIQNKNEPLISTISTLKHVNLLQCKQVNNENN